MDVRARSWITMLVLAVALSFGWATGASGQAAPEGPGGCGTPATPATPANPTPGSPGATPATPAIPANPQQCAPGPDGVIGTPDDVPIVSGAGGEAIPFRADTGAGGTAGGVSTGTLALFGGGLLALAAAIAARRWAPSRRA